MPAAESDVRPDRAAMLWEWFLRLVVAAAGMILGTILAVFIGLISGWIELNC